MVSVDGEEGDVFEGGTPDCVSLQPPPPRQPCWRPQTPSFWGARPQAPGSPGPPRPPILVLQSRAILFYIFRRMLGGTISFPLGLLRSTAQIYYYLVLQHLGRALNLVFQQVCIQTQQCLFGGGTISFYRSNACFRGVLTDVRHGSRDENTVRRSYVLYIYIYVCTP